MPNQTKLQKIRISKNLSQNELAKLSGVNFRTLQDFDQGRKSLSNAKGEMIYRLSLALNVSTDELLEINIDSMNHELAQKQRLKRYAEELRPRKMSYYSEYYTFPIVVSRSGVRMEHIYPTKQEIAAKIHDALSPRNDILSVMLFGSSISMRCTYDSDTDLAIRLNESENTKEKREEISELVQELCDWKADILWFDRISPNDRVYHDICRGVQIV